MASLSVPVRTVVPSIHPSSSTAVARARLGLHYGCCHYFRQPPFRLLVHAHAGHPRGRPCGVPWRSNRGRRGAAWATARIAPTRPSSPTSRSDTGLFHASFHPGAGPRTHKEQRRCTVGRCSGGCRGRPCGVPARLRARSRMLTHSRTKQPRPWWISRWASARPTGALGSPQGRPYAAFVADTV